MVKRIYGIDVSKKVTPLDVRDAMIKCFIKAHDEILQKKRKFFNDAKEFEKFKEMNIRNFIEGLFREAKEDFENPTKEGLSNVCDTLAEFAKNFRSEDIVNKHYSEISELIDHIKE